MSKYNRYSFLLWENDPLNETFNPLWLPMAPYEIYPDIKSHLNHFLVPTPHITGRRGWGTHVIVSLCYWFILCSLLSGGNPPITPAIVARYNVIILLSDHIGVLHFMDRKFGACVMEVHCVKNQFEWMFSWFSLSVSLDLRSWQFLVMGLHNIFLSKNSVLVRKNPCLNCSLKVAPWQSEGTAFSGDILYLFELFYGISTRNRMQ